MEGQIPGITFISPTLVLSSNTILTQTTPNPITQTTFTAKPGTTPKIGNKRKTTWTIINRKATLLPTNTRDTTRIRNDIPEKMFKEQFELIKFLGWFFNENLIHANDTNWEIIPEKMEKHI